MSRYIILLGLLAVLGAVYGEDKEVNCKNNEKWNLCGQICEPTCDVPKPNPVWCPAIECTKFTSDCRCDSGWVRDKTSGSCVQLENCPKKQDQQ
ncbi:chymotrypsin inhibitor-like [Andrena cerasifolii]|uniref:chymotrypsin inhibitor-like n=1 Tax=Andrena cerasifolii TaxID=2819439 RepID=UPI004037F3BC